MAAAGVDQRADRGVARAARGEARARARLPARPAPPAGPPGSAGAARPVDELVGRAHVAVERVDGGPDVARAGGAWRSSRSGRGAGARGGRPRRTRAAGRPIGAVSDGADDAHWRAHARDTSRHSVRSTLSDPHHARAARQDDDLRDRQGRRRQEHGRGGARRSLAAARGRRTIVCELAEQDRISRVFRREGVGAHETRARRRAVGDHHRPAGGAEGVAEPPGRLAAALRSLLSSHAFQYFVAAAPGARELVTIGQGVGPRAGRALGPQARRATTSWWSTRPASGHGLGMLRTPRTFGDIARVGPIRRQADRIHEFLTDPTRIGYLAVALPEEMPVNETLEFETSLERAARDGTRRDRGQRPLPAALHRRPGRGARGGGEQRGRARGALGAAAPRSPSTGAPGPSARSSGGCGAGRSRTW